MTYIRVLMIDKSTLTMLLKNDVTCSKKKNPSYSFSMKNVASLCYKIKLF